MHAAVQDPEDIRLLEYRRPATELVDRLQVVGVTLGGAWIEPVSRMSVGEKKTDAILSYRG